MLAYNNSMARIVAFANQKGGVGKTTSALNVTAAMVEHGQRALLIDLDASSHSLTTAFGIDGSTLQRTVYDAIIKRDVPMASVVLPIRPGIDFVPATRALSGANAELTTVMNREHVLARKLGPVQDRYDFIAIDCGPDLGQLTVNALTAAHQVLIPCSCEFLALKG